MPAHDLAIRLEDRSQHGDVGTGEWGRISLPLADFAPSWRGRPVPDAPALDPAGIRQVGLMIADKQAGPFRLAVRSIALAGTADPGSGE